MSRKLGPNLQLKVTKGPSSGHESVFKPGIKVNLGRVVRGNKVSIKDAGISSRHLTLQFDSGSGRWTVTDLDSSNGTVLNSTPLTPSDPYPLSDNDVIRIGEETVILVHLGVIDEGNSCRPVRVTRGRAAKLGDIDENCELGLGFGEELVENEKKKGRGRRVRTLRDEVNESGKACEASEKKLGEKEAKEEGEAIMSLKRATRSSKRVENLEHGAKIAVVKRGGRVTRSARKAEILVNAVADTKGTENMGAVEDALGIKLRKSTEKEDSLTENHNQGGEIVKLDVTDGRRRRKGARGRKNVEVEVEVLESFGNRQIRNKENGYNGCPGEDENGETREKEMVVNSMIEEEECGGEEKNREGDRVENAQEKENDDLGRTDGEELTGSSALKENNVLEKMEKMTLGEWFDYLEEYMPKQIIEETEEMILQMRLKAEKVHEFMLQQKTAKG